MKLAIIGITGNVGKHILEESLRRGHTVTGIARDTSKLSPRDGLTLVSGDADQPEALASLLKGHNVVISSVPFLSSDPAKLIEAVRRSGVKRYLVVGGAGALEVAPGKLLLDTPHFAELPESIQTEALAGKVLFDRLRAVTDLDWTMLSPSALFVEGDRTRIFRLGKDTLLTAADGKSWISFDDYSIALLDEVENPRNVKARFTVGY
jgi:putative NADH-flavin reductase